MGLSYGLGTGFDVNLREEVLLTDKNAACESTIALPSQLCHQNYSRNTAQHKGRQEAGTRSFWHSAEQALAVGSQSGF